MAHQRAPLFSRRKALWRSSWLPLAILALLLCHATFGVRLADFAARLASKVAHRKFETGRENRAQIELQGELWSLKYQNRELKMQLRAKESAAAMSLETAYGFQSLPARIVLRDARDWASFIWVEMPEPATAFLLAPAVCGDVAIGMVDFASQNRCRIRLLSDSQISLSVTVTKNLSRLSSAQNDEPLVGQVRGLGGAIWASSGTILIGEGYVPNPPKDSLTDRHAEFKRSKRRFALDDQLVTSGLDGLFPPDLKVGRVDRIDEDSPGATRYAFGVIGALNLSDLTEISILKKTELLKIEDLTDQN